MRTPRQSTLPLWKQLWQRLTPEQQKKARSVAWSVSVHFLMLTLLAAIPLTMEAMTPPPILITAVAADDGELESLAVSTMAEDLEAISDQIELEPEPLELEAPEIMDLDSLVDLAAPVLEQGEVQPASHEEATSSGTAGESLAEGGSDAELIAETDRRVGKAGGALEGPVRVSLMFSGDADIDLHVKYASAERQQFAMRHIYFGAPASEHARLDVDANAHTIVPEPCENIIFHTVFPKANYTVALHCFRAPRNMKPTPYVVTVKRGKKTDVYKGKLVPFGPFKTICEFRYSAS